ncbi:hypothetical protein AB0E69_11970 [Kribbella sp. NPDC026611]|uniref:hypothetical protein n=1 Tax=Kribbella sp. NPDC026611 TaxID=3154911 RepID=UPI003402CBEC
MTEISVGDVNEYLADAGWSRTEQIWHGATIWSNGSDEVLVPPRDGMGDGVARLRELLATLGHVENRPVTEVARDIAYPLIDSTVYVSPAAAGPEGFVPLNSGLGALQGVHGMLRTAAAEVLSAPRFQSGTDNAVADLLRGVQLGTVTSEQIAWAFAIPIQFGPNGYPVGRQVLLRMYQAATAVRRALDVGNPRWELAGAVDSEFCTALSTLAGEELTRPFQLEFHWGRGVPSELPDQLLAFPAGAGEAIQDISRQLDERLSLPAASVHVPELDGPATIVGQIEALHDSATGDDRWRVKVRGQLTAGDRRPTRRVIWVRLAEQADYELALAAHQGQKRIEVTGTWTDRMRPVRILADAGGIRVLDQQDPQ